MIPEYDVTSMLRRHCYIIDRKKVHTSYGLDYRQSQVRDISLLSGVVALVAAANGDNSINGVVASSLLHIVVVGDVELPTLLFWSEEGQEDDERVHATEEDADDEAVVVACGLALWW